MVVLRSGFHKKVNFALLLIDAYTDEIVKNTVSVSAYSGLYRPIRKNDGYFVFADLGIDGLFNIDIQSDLYEQKILTVDLSSVNPSRPIVKHKLTPKSRYLPDNITAIAGRSSPGSKISIIYENSVNTYKLLYDIKKGQDSIHIYNPAGKDLEGEEFAIVNKQSDILGIISLGVKKDSGIYETIPFAKPYKKSENSLLRVCVISAGENGEFFYPLRNFDEKNKIVRLVTDDSLKNIKSTELEKGIVNHI